MSGKTPERSRLRLATPVAPAVVPAAASEDDRTKSTPAGSRSLAPGSPSSPGPLPLALAEHVPFGEAVIWWGAKDRIDLRGVGLLLAALTGVLVIATLLVPEFWDQPWRILWRPLLVLLSPVLLVLIRERANLRATIVTDTAIVDVPVHGDVERLGFDNIRRVRRDLLRGGISLDGARHRVRIPPSLMDDARNAIASQRAVQFRPVVDQQLDDRTGWLP